MPLIVLFLVVVLSAATVPEGEKWALQKRLAINNSPQGISPQSFLPIINVDSLITAARKNPSKKVKVMIADSGLYERDPVIGSKINKNLSWSCVDNAPTIDEEGHGTTIAQIIDSVASKEVEFVSFKVLEFKFNIARGTTDCLISAIERAGKLDEFVIMNLSLQNYAPSQLLADTMAKQKNILFVTIAGNNEVQPVTYPGYYAYDLPNGLCVGAGELDPQKNWVRSTYSNWGVRADLTALGTYSPEVKGTSFSAPEVVGTAALLRQFGDFSPELLKKLILVGSRYEPLLAGVIGDPNRFPARRLDGNGAYLALQRLEKIFLNSQPVVTVGEDFKVNTSEDPSWLSGFFSIWDNSVPQFQLTDSLGKVSVLTGKWENLELSFPAPQAGEYKVRLLIEGIPFGNEFALSVNERQPFEPNYVSGKIGGTVKFLLKTKSIEKVSVWIRTDEDETWWELKVSSIAQSQEFTGWWEVEVTIEPKVADKNFPKLANAWYTLNLVVDDEFVDPFFISLQQKEE